MKTLDFSHLLIADGATGTQLQKAGLPRGVPPERWNLENPQAILNHHKSYADAGSDIVLTNTFGGTRVRLEKEGLADRVHEINSAAARLAREAVGPERYVFGDIGPLGKLLKPYGPLTYEQAVQAFTEQARGLAEGPIDAFLIETMSDLNEVRAAFEGVRSVSDLPVLVTLSFDTHGHTMMGVKPEIAAKEIIKLGAAAGGANCGNTLTETYAAVEKMKAAEPGLILIAKPNAGLPRLAQAGEKKTAVYDVTPEEMAEFALKFKELGVRIFGGCCGSTPDHIRLVARALKG
jgi:5-methyltetrahydrofolate--homocysteine methyltransferase